MKKLDISVVIPLYNEEKNIPLISNKINKVMQKYNKNYEIIFINDGSTDNSLKVLNDVRKKYNNIKIINFTYNKGQTIAMDKGFQVAVGNIVVTMDADLQNFPEDILPLINKINNGYDVVCGWRYERKDDLVSKKLPSYLNNLLIRIITGLKIKDAGCSLRAYKKEVVKNLHLSGEMHRFIPIVLAKKGLKISQVKVKHMKRIYGESKYGPSRFFRGFIDLLFVIFLGKYSKKPIYISRFLGFISILAGIILLIINLLFSLFVQTMHINPIINNKIFLISSLLVLIGIFFPILISLIKTKEK